MSAPPDAFRCHRSDGRRWRCSKPCSPGRTFCPHHHLAAVSNSNKIKKKNAASSEALRCRRSGNCGWRCSNSGTPGRAVCHRHALLAPSQNEKRMTRRPMKKPAAPPSPPALPPPACRVVALGDIWALPHDSDRLPRAYARIDRIHPTVSMVEVAPLAFHPCSPDELRWASASLPVACGTFRPSGPAALKPIAALSHLALSPSPAARPLYRIFPAKGEVWAIYRDSDVGSASSPLFDLVEVVSDFTEDRRVRVVALGGDERGLFRRQFVDGYELARTFTKTELPLFSHRVPAFWLAGEQWLGPQGILWRVGRC